MRPPRFRLQRAPQCPVAALVRVRASAGEGLQAEGVHPKWVTPARKYAKTIKQSLHMTWYDMIWPYFGDPCCHGQTFRETTLVWNKTSAALRRQRKFSTGKSVTHSTSSMPKPCTGDVFRNKYNGWWKRIYYVILGRWNKHMDRLHQPPPELRADASAPGLRTLSNTTSGEVWRHYGAASRSWIHMIHSFTYFQPQFLSHTNMLIHRWNTKIKSYTLLVTQKHPTNSVGYWFAGESHKTEMNSFEGLWYVFSPMVFSNICPPWNHSFMSSSFVANIPFIGWFGISFASFIKSFALTLHVIHQL